MRSRLTAVVTAFAMLGLAPSLAMAESVGVQDQLQQMQDRLQNMEDRLQATNDQLDAANQRVEDQADLIQSSGIADKRGASSGLGCFVCELTIGGWVAGSYNYNLNDPNDAHNDDNGLDGTNQGEGGFFYPFHPNHNSFEVDQVWFEVEREITEEHRAGFRFDVLYGTTARQLGGPLASGNDNSDINVYQAYVQYAPPIGPEGTTIKFGKFATLVGAEVTPTIYNYNITRGDVFNLLEPINHIGVLVGGPIGDTGLDWAIGGANGFSADASDINDQKTILGHIGWGNDTFSVGTNVVWGSETLGFDGDQAGLVNLLLNWNPSDRFSMYLNGDFAWMDSPNETNLNPKAWGVSLAGRYAITDRTGFALRGEYVQDVDGFILQNGRSGGLRASVCPGAGMDGCYDGGPDRVGVDQLWSATATLDHLLTDHLMVRGEARWDFMNLGNFGGSNAIFFKNNGHDDNFLTPESRDQIVLALEVIYNFNKFGGK